VHRTHLGVQLSVRISTFDMREPLLLYFAIFISLLPGKIKFLRLHARTYALRQYWRKQCSEYCQRGRYDRGDSCIHNPHLRVAQAGRRSG